MNDPPAFDAPRPSGPERRGWLYHLSLDCAWVTALTLALFVVLRLVCHDAAVILVWANSFTLYFYLPAYACLAWAVWQRHWRLAALSSLIIAFHLAWVLPHFQLARQFAPAAVPDAAAAPTVRIFYANVRSHNTEYDAMLQEIAAANPDVIFLNEFMRPWQATFEISPVIQPYLRQHGLQRHRVGYMGFYSRLPVSDFQHIMLSGRLVCAFNVAVGNDQLRLFCLHGPRPLDDTIARYFQYWASIRSILAEQPKPLVVIGDFNATYYAWAYQQLTALGLRSAHADLGRDYATTWPNGQYWLPPIRIDHALLSPGVECVRIVEGRGTGSDHRPLILDVQLRPAD
jgi:endonuclease/exonuclease/phosphatase (EEP) superfamily protein YafD